MANALRTIVIIVFTIFIEVFQKFFWERDDDTSHSVYHRIKLNHSLSSFMEEETQAPEEEYLFCSLFLYIHSSYHWQYQKQTFFPHH